MDINSSALKTSLGFLGFIGTIVFGLTTLLDITVPANQIIHFSNSYLGIINEKEALIVGRLGLAICALTLFCFLGFLLYFIFLKYYHYQFSRKQKRIDQEFNRIKESSYRSHNLITSLKNEILRERDGKISGKNVLLSQAGRLREVLLIYDEYCALCNEEELQKFLILYKTAYNHFREEILEILGRNIPHNPNKKADIESINVREVLSESNFGTTCVTKIYDQIIQKT